VLLHLISEHKINTHFNAYTALWSDCLMSEIQRNILLVIKQRAERSLQPLTDLQQGIVLPRTLGWGGLPSGTL